MIKNYLKIAWRNLWRNKSFAFINIFGLAIGINACLIIYLIVSYEFSFDQHHPDREKIYRITSDIHVADEIYKNPGVPAPLAKAVEESIPGIEVVAPFHLHDFQHIWLSDKSSSSLKKDYLASLSPEDAAWESSVIAGPHFFQLFPHKWLIGDPKSALEEPYKVVLSRKKAQKYFGNRPLPEMIGKVIRYADYRDTLSFTVSGIIEPNTKNSDFKFHDFLSISSMEKNSHWAEGVANQDWASTTSSSQLILKLAPKVQASKVASKLPALVKKHSDEKEDNFYTVFKLQPLNDIHFNPEYGGNNIKVAHLPTLYSLIGIAVFLLMIAAINFINLTTAQSSLRAKEIGVRKVLGSTRWHLKGQFLFEALLISFLASILSLVLIEPMMQLFSEMLVKDIRNSIYSLESGVFLIGIILITSLLSGFYPAWVLSSLAPVSSLKNQTSKRGSRKSNLRRGLIIFQFTFAQVFIIGTLVVNSQVNFLLEQDLGFKQEAIINFYTPWMGDQKKKDRLLEQVKKMPEVQMASLSNSVPFSRSTSTNSIKYIGPDSKVFENNVHRKSGDENFLELYEIDILAGRNVRKADSLREVMINAHYAKLLGFDKPQEALGKYLEVHEKNVPIVGVFSNFNVQSLHHEMQPTYHIYDKEGSTTLSIKLYPENYQPKNIETFLAKVKNKWEAIYPNDPFKARFLDESIAQVYKSEKLTAHLLQVATAVAIFISCIGLFGLVTFTVQQRVKEIGIRKVLGASVRQITSLLSFEFLSLVGLSILIASPIAYYFASRWLEDFAYRMDLNGLIFIMAALISIMITLITVSFRTLRAARRNPVESLRYE